MKRKDARRPPVRRSPVKEPSCHLYRSSSSWFFSSFRPIVWFLFPTSPAQDPPLGCTCTLSPDGSQSRKHKKSKIHYGLALSMTFDPQAAFPCMYSVSLVPKGGRDSLIFIQTGFASSSVQVTITLKVFTRNKHCGYLPSFCFYFHFRGKQEADCRCLQWSPPISCLRNCKQEASCKCV